MKKISQCLILTIAVLLVSNILVQTISAQRVDGLKRNQHTYDLPKGATVFSLSATCYDRSCTQLKLLIYDKNKLLDSENVVCDENEVTENYYYTDIQGILREGQKVVGYKTKCQISMRLPVSDSQVGVYSAVVENKGNSVVSYSLTASKDKVPCEGFAGEWDEQGSKLYINVDGSKAEGKYFLGDEFPATFKGTINGNVLEGDYIEHAYNNPNKTFTGKIRMMITDGILTHKADRQSVSRTYRCALDVKYNPQGADLNRALGNMILGPIGLGSSERVETIPEKSPIIYNVTNVKSAPANSAKTAPIKPKVGSATLAKTKVGKTAPVKTKVASQPKQSPTAVNEETVINKVLPTKVPKANAKKELTIAEKNNQLWDASFKGEVDKVKQLLADNADPNFEKKGYTPLMLAALYGHTEILKKLLLTDANINGKNNLGVTVLMVAARGSHIETVKILIAQGANICDVDNGGRSAVAFAEMSGKEFSDIKGLNPEGRDYKVVAEILKKEQKEQCKEQNSNKSDTTQKKSPSSTPKDESKTKKTIKGILNRVIRIN